MPLPEHQSVADLPGSTALQLLIQTISLVGPQGFDIPDALGILVDTTVGAEETHPGHAGDTLGNPFFLVAIRVVDEGVGLDVAVEVIRYEVVITMVTNSRDHSSKIIGRAECAFLDSFEHLGQVRVHSVGAVRMRMAEILNIFGEIAEEEYIVLANFTGNFNLTHC